MKKFIYTLILFFIVVNFLFSQEIQIIRTDVDSSRANFITATYNFSFKIKLKDVSNCTAVSFVIRHNQTNYVKFSNYRIFPFSKNGSVFVYPWFNPLDGFERIYAGILNGDTIGGKGENNPEVIEFEFSVSPDAPSNSVVEFYFEDAEAVLTENNVGKVIKLKSQPLFLNIHGFVNVWPGDANNDGIVNINDVSTVALYLGYGPNKSNFRSFQRINPSTNWFPQLCLAWDSLATTYADCDGDGEVTINDMLIIPLNFGKTQFLKSITPSNKDEVKPVALIQTSEFNIPYTILSDEPIVGFVAEISEPQTIFPSKTYSETNLNSNNTFFSVLNGNTKDIITCGSTNLEPINEKIVCWGKQETEILGKGITNSGKIIPAKLTTKRLPSSINDNYNGNLLSEINDFPFELTIYNLIGQKVYASVIFSEEEFINVVTNQSYGVYLFLIQTNKTTKFLKILTNRN